WPPRPSPMTTLVAQFPGAISDPFLHRRWEGGVRNRDALEARHGTSHPSGARAQSKGKVGQVDPYAGSFARGSAAPFDSNKFSRRWLRPSARRAQSVLTAEQASDTGLRQKDSARDLPVRGGGRHKFLRCAVGRCQPGEALHSLTRPDHQGDVLVRLLLVLLSEHPGKLDSAMEARAPYRTSGAPPSRGRARAWRP